MTSDLPEVRRVQVGPISLALAERGKGPAVLLVHAYPLDHTMWQAQLEALTGVRLLAPDLRGFGESDAPADPAAYSMAAYADDLAELLTQLGEEKCVLCGLSMGGYISFEMLRRYRARVRALVLMDTRAEPDTPEAREGRVRASGAAQRDGAGAIADVMVGKLVAATTMRERTGVVTAVRGMIERAPVGGIIGALAAMRERPDSTPLLAELKGLPTLVIVGAEDALTPPAAMGRMAEKIPGARFEVIRGAGHLPPLEAPEATNQLLAGFLRGLGETRPMAGP